MDYFDSRFFNLMKIHIYFLMFLTSSTVLGQQVEWASNVLEYSSERSPIQYAAIQILGEPNVMPHGGEHPGAWSPAKPDGQEFITVEFKNCLSIRQIAIAESFNPGALSAIFAISKEGESYKLIQLEKQPLGLTGSMFNFFLPATSYLVKAIRLEFDGSRVEGYFNIDAIAISDTEWPIEAQVRVNPGLRGDLSLEPLGDKVNSPHNELRPLLSPDGTELYFTRQFFLENDQGSEDPGNIWVSQYNSETKKWDDAVALGPAVNTDDEDYMSALMSQGSGILALVGKKTTKGKGSKHKLMLTDNLSDSWREPVPLDFVTNPEFEGQLDFTLSENRRTMVLAVMRGDSYGDQDLYVSFLQRNGLWSDPLSLGMTINTVARESSPFLSKDGKTLFFASAGFSGMGGSDIYSSTRIDDTWQNWTEPENLGPIINTDKDEFYFVLPDNSDFAYFSRFVTEDNADVFKVSLPLYEMPVKEKKLIITLRDKNTREKVEGSLKFINDGQDFSGNAFALVSTENQFVVAIRSEGYYPINETFEIEATEECLSKEIFLDPVDRVLAFNRIRFRSNAIAFLKDSYVDLKTVASILKSHSEIKLAIESHTDDVGSSAANLALSEKRGQVVFEYLVSEGVKTDRLKVLWFGETQPIATNETKEGRRKNRRVEFRVLLD